MDTFRRKFGIDLESRFRASLSAREGFTTLHLSRQLVYFDIKDLFTLTAAEATSPSRVKTLLRIAYLDYLLLSPHIRNIDSTSDQAIKTNFQRASELSNFPQKLEFVVLLEKIDSDIIRSLGGNL